MEVSRAQEVIRFGLFVLDPAAGQLTRQGANLRLPQQPMQLLAMLLERPGEILTREELRQRLWPSGVFVDFDHGLNKSIQKIRDALGDSAVSPRYIETIPRIGYRFIAPVSGNKLAPVIVEHPAAGAAAPGADDPSNLPPPMLPVETTPPGRQGRWRVITVGIAPLLILSVVTFWVERQRSRVPGARPIQSLAVLPVKNLSGDPSQQYLADGMTDELITSLGQIRSLRVISLTTAMQYKEARKPLQQIARELNVDAIVEGSVLRSGERIRIAAHLVDASVEKQLWVHNYEGDLRDMLGLQSQVASAVADQIRVKLTPKEQTELADAKNKDPRAYDAFLKGNYFFRQNSPATLEKSLQYFEQAVALDPTLARAYVGIARCYNFLAQGPALGHGIVSAGEATAASDSAVAQALRIQPDLSEAYAERAWTLLFYHWDFPGTERDFRHALELNPGSADAHEGYGTYLVIMGRFDDGLAQMKEAGNIDPLSPFFLKDYCTQLNYARRYDEAVTECLAALELDPNLKWGLSHLADTYLQKGEYAKAHEILARLGDCDAACMAMEDEVHGAPGRRGAFDSWLKTQKAPNAFFLAQAYAGLGRKDEAFAALERAYEEHSNPHFMTYSSIDAHFDSLRSDPRFDLFLRQSGLPPQPHDLLALRGQFPRN